jgi:hypothetical protein
LKDRQNYSRVFSEDYPIELYYACISIVRKVDEVLEVVEESRKQTKTNIRFYAAYLLTARLAGTARLRPGAITQIKLSEIPVEVVLASIMDVFHAYVDLGESDQVAKGPQLKQRIADRFLSGQTQVRVISGGYQRTD